MRALRREAGLATWFDPGSDKPLREVMTVQCVHCMKHFSPKIGSGKVRGFCQNCNGFICGPNCIECVPAEKYLDIIEGRLNPTAISVGGHLWFPSVTD